MREKLKRLNIWRPVARRYGRKWALLLLGVPIALIIGGGAYASLLLATGGGSINLQNGLVGWWKLDGNALDSSPYGHNGTVTGAVPAADREGNATGAYSFNGSSDNISAGNITSMNSMSAVTVSAWIKTASVATGGIISKDDSGSNRSWEFLLNSGKFRFNPKGNVVGLDSASTVNDNNWHLVTATYDGSTGTCNMYLDGSLDATGSCGTGTTGTGSTAVQLGARSTNYFGGSIDDARVYNRVISSAEAAALYQAYNPQLNAASGEKGLVGRWKLDGNAKDATPYAHNGVIAGGAPPVADRNGKANGAYSFNGTNQYITYSTTTIPTLTNFSATMWVYINGDGSSAINGVMNGKAFRFFINNSGNKIRSQIAGATPYDNTTTISVTRGQWVHLALVYDGTNRYYYMNGSLVATVPTTGTPTNANDGEIGSIQGSTYDFNGYIDDARLYNRPLSGTDVSNLYDSYDSQINLYRSAGSSGSGADIASNLIGQWNFTGNAKDSTPYSDDGSVNGATLTSNRFGNANQAYSFNGSSDFISLGTPSTLEGQQVPLTISGWFNMSSTSPADKPIYAAYSSTSGGHLWSLIRIDGSTFRYFTSNSIGNYQYVSPFSVSTGTWHFFAVVIGGSVSSPTYTIYLDGSSQSGSFSALSSSPNLSVPIYIGGDAAGGGERFPGSIDDIRVYSRALSTTDVQALYNLTE